MSFLTIVSCLLAIVYDCSAVYIMPELKKNILNFGYGVNFKYEGMLSHSFDRFYIVTKFELPKTKDLKLYERFIEELKLYSRAIRVLSKGYLPISLLPPSKLEKILNEVRITIAKSNKDDDLVLTRLYLYYDRKLVTFGIDNQRNLIVQSLFLFNHTLRKD